MSDRPLLVVPAIPEEGGIKFVLPDEVALLDHEESSLTWPILALCDGSNSVDTIVEMLPDIDRDFIAGCISDLKSLGILIDNREAYRHFHVASESKMSVSDEESLSVDRGSFSAEKLHFHEVSDLLDNARPAEWRDASKSHAPYPIGMFAVVLEDQLDFPAGYYEYDCKSGRLVRFEDQPDEQRICYAFNEIGMPYGAQLVIILAADAGMQPSDYSNHTYRQTAIEVGRVSQRVSFATTGTDIAIREVEVMRGEAVAAELNRGDCLPLIALAVGKGSSSSEGSSSRLLAKLTKEFERESNPVQDSWLVDDVLADNHDKSYVHYQALTRNGRITTGISASTADAKLKAIVEGYERQRAACMRFDIRASANDLPAPWLDPRVVAPLTDEQYARMTHLQKFDERLEIEWVSGTRYDDRSVYVPVDLMFRPLPDIGRKLVVDTTSSGFAAYTDFEEAERRGVLELVERDSLMRNWYEKKSPRVLTHDVLPTYLKRRVEYWEALGRHIFVLDLSQRGVIVIEVMIVADEYPCLMSGAASTLDRFENAAIKAFHEAESRMIYWLNHPDERWLEPHDVVSISDHEQLYSHSKRFHEHLRFMFEGEMSNVRPVATSNMSDLKEALRIVTVDASETGSSLRVVKAISPELVPISFGYGSGHYSHHSLTSAEVGRSALPHYFA